MNATRIEITQPKSSEFDADPDLRSALDDHRHGSFLRRAADAGNLYIARLDGAYAGGMVLGGTDAGQPVFDGSFFGRGFVWLIWVEEPFRRKGVASALMRQVPHVEVHFVDNGLDHPTGVGEVPVPSFISALTEAVCAATGQTIVSFPMKLQGYTFLDG